MPEKTRRRHGAGCRVTDGPASGRHARTLAPEQVPEGVIEQLAKAGVRVALGHSMATYARTKAALAQGLTGFTHLLNAMRLPAAREPGPIVAGLETRGAWFGMIVDRYHVDPALLRLALRGLARPKLVADAMPTVGGAARASRSTARTSAFARAVA